MGNCFTPRPPGGCTRPPLPPGSYLPEELVSHYQAKYGNFHDQYRELETITDFVCGKNNGSGKPGEKFKKHTHQRRLTDEAIKNIVANIEASGISSIHFDDFEQLIEFVRTPEIPYFKLTNSYDFAFRFALKHNLLPEKYVYIHAGAREGANILRQKGYLTFDLHDCKIPHENFPPEFRQLPAYHLENLLCVMKKELADLPPAGIKSSK